MKPILLFSIAFVLLVAPLQSLEKLKNIGYLSYGYDIYFGNPNPTKGFDPGFRNYPIFEFQYTQNQETSDGLFSLPDHVEATGQTLCNLDMTSTTITSTTSFKNSLKVSVEVTGEYGPASFSASTDYTNVEEGTTKNNNIYLSSLGQCSIYNAQINPFYLPPVDDSFLSEIMDLPSEYNSTTKTQFLEFIRRRGTHYFTGIVMGAKYGFFSTVTKSGWTKMASQGIKVSLAASYSAMVKVGVKTTTDVQREQGSTFDKEVTETKQITVGSTPPADGSAVTWANNCFNYPMPVKYTLDSIANLFTSRFLPNVSNVDNLQNNIKSALGEYCGYLKSKNLIKDCVESDVDKPLPTVSTACRLCAGGCGGSFPVDGGAMSMDQSWSNFFMTYDSQCSGNYGHNYYNKGQGVHLCCQKEDETIVGQCQFCTTCGGQFSNGGAVMCDQQWSNWISAFDNGCYGDRRSRYHNGQGIQMCCRGKEEICSLCSSCGGAFPEENGVMSHDQNWPNFFNIRSYGCAGGFGHNRYSAGLSLCCKNRGAK